VTAAVRQIGCLARRWTARGGGRFASAPPGPDHAQITSAGFAHGVAQTVLIQRRSNASRGEGIMFKHRYHLPLLAAIAIAGLGVTQATHAQETLTQRVQDEKSMNLPARGMSMDEVEKEYGAPLRKLSPRGGDTAKHPTINRWEYANFIVYFERSHVIHSVLNTPAGNNTNPGAVN
jgi:hypothetical protein